MVTNTTTQLGLEETLQGIVRSTLQGGAFIYQFGSTIRKALEGRVVGYYRQTTGKSSVLPDGDAMRSFRIVEILAMGTTSHGGAWVNALSEDLDSGKQAVRSFRVLGLVDPQAIA